MLIFIDFSRLKGHSYNITIVKNMANTKLNFLRRPGQLVFIVSVVLAGFVFLHSPKAAAAACPTPTVDMGSSTSTVNVTSAGIYRIWSRMTQGTATSDNSYSLEITDPGGTKTCFVVGDSTLPTTFNNDSTNWVDYQNATSSSKINITVAASGTNVTGNYTVKMIGREDGVKLDRVGLYQVASTTDVGCVPTGTGDNCFPPADTTPPTVSITSPAPNAKVRGTITLEATASDTAPGTVDRVEFWNGLLKIGTATTAPYRVSWDTTGPTATPTSSLVARAYDSSGNLKDSTTVTVTVDNTPPTVSLSSPTAGSYSGIVSLAAIAEDINGTGVSSVNFYYGTTLIASDPTSPYSYSWQTCGIANGSYTLTATAFDAAGNPRTSTGVNIILNNASNCSDPISPTTSIATINGVTPTNGMTLSGATNSVVVAADDNVGVDSVELYIDGVKSGAADTSAPYIFNVDTTGLLSGTHTLSSKAYDAIGNPPGTSAVLSFTVPTRSTNPGDVNGDGHVTVIDLSTLLTNYGASGDRSKGDLNNDGIINVIDLSTLLSYYGT